MYLKIAWQKWSGRNKAMSEDQILVFDIGTSKLKAGVYSEQGVKIAESAREMDINYPAEGWAEQDPEKWMHFIVDLSKEILMKMGQANIKGIGVTGQLMGLVPVNINMKHLRNAIIWLDSRAEQEAEEILSSISVMDFLEMTGGIPTGKDVIAKILWLKNHEPEIFDKTRYFLDVKDYIIYRLTNNVVTDISTAAVRGLIDVRIKNWSETLCNIIGTTVDKLPDITETKSVIGNLKNEKMLNLGISKEVEVINGAGDAFVTPFGAGAVKDGKAHYYLGTSSWASTHVSDPLMNEERGIGSVYSAIPGKWLLISESESAGSCLDWFMSNIYKAKDDKAYREINENVSKSKPGSKNLIFLPWLYGERSPVLDVYARGGFVNLSLDHNINDLSRSVMEGIAMNAKWMVEGISETGINFSSINVVGGGAKSEIWMQILSDILKMEVKRVADPQNVTLRGSAMLTLLGLNYLKTVEETESLIKIDRTFVQNQDNAQVYDKLFENYKKIYSSLKEIFENLNS
jgi:xylulokinase